MKKLKIGNKAPEFKLTADNGKVVSLKDFRGQKVILYFYPKDLTSGCTAEACDFRDNIRNIDKKNAIVIGVSADDTKSHVKFKEKYDLPFTLLSDPGKKMLEDYGVWQEKSMYGKKYMGIVRTTLVIDEKGVIEKIYEKVKVNGHVEEIVKSL